MSHANPIIPAIEAQADALRGIAVADGYLTDLGASVLYPAPMDGDRPASAIVLDGGYQAESDLRRGTVAVRTEWVAVVVGEPAGLLRMASDAQTDMVAALSTVCGLTVMRGGVGGREFGSNYMAASVTAAATVNEVTQ